MTNMVDGEGDLYWQTPDGNIVYLGRADLKDAEPEFDIPDEWRDGETFTMKIEFEEDDEEIVNLEEMFTSYYDEVRKQWLSMKFPLFVWN